MIDDAIELVFEHILRTAAARLDGYGYVRSRRVLRFIANENAALIEFQRSMRSSADRILFTIEIAVVCGGLLDAQGVDINRARAVDAHYRQRVGQLLPAHSDVWWEINSGTDPDGIAVEISKILDEDVRPVLDKLIATQALIALWRSGSEPGLTEGQRTRYLSRALALI
jgi:hypothetical protein